VLDPEWLALQVGSTDVRVPECLGELPDDVDAQVAAGLARERAVRDIGYPENINPQYGLARLRSGLRSHGQPTDQAWLSLDEPYQLFETTTCLMSGAARYYGGACAARPTALCGWPIWGPGYKGVRDIISRDDYQRLGGFSVVWLM
jgi:hypothetical protein